MKYILSLDQGTTSSRAIVFDSSGHIVAKAQREFRQIYPQPGWLEHDALELWDSQYAVAVEALRAHQISPKQVVAIGIANQRETTIIWDRKTGIPIANAIVWQDRRTSSACDSLNKNGYAELVLKKTGLKIDPYFSATKIAWLLDSIPGARESANRGELAFGTVDSWLVWRMTEGKVHATDATNASRTMLFNINLGDWDEELLTLFKIPRQILPVVHPSRSMFGYASAELAGIPICALAGDQQAALFGQVCTKPGMVKNTYGTGCFLLMNIGSEPLLSKNNLITSMICRADKQFAYALEGSVFIAGAAVQWLRDGLRIINSSADVEPLAKSVNDNGGVYMVPAFSGLGAPHWDPLARGVITGITGGVSAGHIARATLESIAFQTADVVRAMEKDSGQSLVELRVDGGASTNELLMQFQADLLDVPVLSPVITETTALGVAYLAGLEVGVWGSQEELSSLWQLRKEFTPNMVNSQRVALLDGWYSAVAKARLQSAGTENS